MLELVRVFAFIALVFFSSYSMANPTHQDDVYFDNQSIHNIYVLPENGGLPVEIPAHMRMKMPMDAWMDPELFQLDNKYAVYKVVDNISVIYRGRYDIKTYGGSFREKMGQTLNGGWKDLVWVHANPYFEDFLNQVLAQ